MYDSTDDKFGFRIFWSDMFHLTGVVKRRQYWCGGVFYMIISSLLIYGVWKMWRQAVMVSRVGGAGGGAITLPILLLALFVMFNIAQVTFNVRRINDTGANGMWFLLSIPTLGLSNFVFACIPSGKFGEPRLDVISQAKLDAKRNAELLDNSEVHDDYNSNQRAEAEDKLFGGRTKARVRQGHAQEIDDVPSLKDVEGSDRDYHNEYTDTSASEEAAKAAFQARLKRIREGKKFTKDKVTGKEVEVKPVPGINDKPTSKNGTDNFVQRSRGRVKKKPKDEREPGDR